MPRRYPLKQAAAVFLPALASERPEDVGGRPKTQQFLLMLMTCAWPLGLALGGASYACANASDFFVISTRLIASSTICRASSGEASRAISRKTSFA